MYTDKFFRFRNIQFRVRQYGQKASEHCISWKNISGTYEDVMRGDGTRINKPISAPADVYAALYDFLPFYRRHY